MTPFWTDEAGLALVVRDLQALDTFTSKLRITNQVLGRYRIRLTRRQARRLSKTISLVDRYSK
jgi:hypothetical protein